MKKTYFAPSVRLIDLETEGMIADSIGMGDSGETIDAENAYTQKQEPNFWGREGIWK